MSRYRVDARCFVGSLCAPIRNDTESHECDDWTTTSETAAGLLDRGFTVWIYERVARAGASSVAPDRRGPVVTDLRLVARRDPRSSGTAPGP